MDVQQQASRMAAYILNLPGYSQSEALQDIAAWFSSIAHDVTATEDDYNDAYAVLTEIVSGNVVR